MGRSTQLFPVVEIFGPTIQGEGALAGRVSHFIRFGGCDYRCAWCDTKDAVLPELVRKAQKLDRSQILAAVKSLGGQPQWITLSGGNPALLELHELVVRLQSQLGFKVAIETQGTISKPWLRLLDLVTVSPKPPSSTNVVLPDKLHDFIASLAPDQKVCLKVVVFDAEDFAYASEIHRLFPSLPFYFSVGTYSGGLDGTWLTDIPRAVPGMLGAEPTKGYDTPETISERYRWLSELVAADPALRNTTVLPQLHYLMWGRERGR